MKRFSTFLAALLCTATAIFADGPFRNHRYDSFKVLEPADGSILFIGNSITDMHCWPEVFKTSEGKYLPIVNRGNSGTYSTEQSDNLESYLVNKPKKVFMMIGTNDIATSGGLNFSPEQVLAYVKSMVTRIHARSPQTKVYLYSILKNNTSNRVEATWLRANELTKAYAEATDKVTYIDLYDKLANVASGGAWSYDNLHLTAGAYQAWAKEICQYLQEDENFTVSTVYPDNTLSAQNNGGLGGANGMRATYFSALPISKNDVLIFGDSFIKNGEWQELLGNPNVKNRGTGWGNSGDIATTSKIVDATFAEVEGVTKESPKAILLYTGTGDCTGSTDMKTVKANYKALVDKILQKSPNSIVYLLTLCFRNNESHNKRIQELIDYMAGFPMEYTNLRFVDTGKQLLNNGEMDSKYIFSNDYIGGLAYVKIADLLKSAIRDDFHDDVYTVINDATAEARYAQAGLRNQLTQVIARALLVERGNGVGQYKETDCAALDTKLASSTAVLEKENITESDITTFTNELTAIINELFAKINMPTNSTEGNDVWYQLSTPGRGNKYVTSTGVGAGVVGSDKHNYATGMWKFVARNGGIDIINRHDGSYLAPTAANDTQLTTSATQPATAWTLSYANAASRFIICNGNVQLNQTDKSGTPVYNWGGGSNRDDTGCQYKIELVTAEPDEIPDPSIQTLTLTTNEFQNGSSTWTKYISSSDGWYGKFVTGTTPAVTVESTDLTVNNMGWSSKRPWLQTGYTYNITLPKGLVITEYELTTLEGGGFNGTFTYTTADGTATSPAQTASEQTVSAKGLSTNTISLVVGNGKDGTKGIMMTKLVIKYKEVPVEEETPSEIIYTLNKANGDLYHKNGSANQTWNNIWKSTSEPQLLFGCGDPNNMNWDDSNIQMMTGTSNRSTYTLTAPGGYMIAEYSFTFTNKNHSNGLGLTMDNGAIYTTSTNAQTVSAKNVQQASTVSFVLDGANGNGVVLTNFTVKVRKDIAELPVISTEGKEYWYYITSASTQAYCAGKVMYYDSQMQKMRFGDKELKPTHVWSFWEKDGKLAIKNYNGEYFGTAGSGSGNSTAFGVVSEPNYIYYINEAHGFFVIKDNAVELHAQDDNKVIVRWGAAAGNASLWRFNEVDLSNAEASVASTRVVQGKVSTGIGNVDQAIIRSTIRVAGLEGKVNFQGVKGAFSGTDKADVTNVKAYFATNDRELFIDADKKMTWREENGVQFGQTVALAEDGTFSISGSKEMAPGNYYLWITYDIAETAKEGNLVDASITSYTVDGAEIEEANGNPKHSVTIFLSEGSVLMPMDKGSLYYRIPSITVTTDGKRLVTLTDDRKNHNSDLPSHCYLVAQYSEDNGKTWSDPQTVAGTATTGGNYGHGDASIVTNRDNGEIVGIMTSAGTYGHGFFAGTAAEPPRWKTITSRDGGLTWDAPVDHTDDLFGANCGNEKTKTWKSGFSGSGAALQKRDGTLVSSFVNRQADDSQHFYFFMSKDGGKN
ncbi:MAG: GDSL-type esterase/lipase family protein, partial [Bacteroidaceae bacterium]|nr:GDSL-type esterase/lipase family protein [Bacteroidaceae bacterium]